MKNRTDVLVIGGGPAGSTSAALLAREGFDVTLLEKEEHPRFHIGESLLPSTKHVLEVMGVLDKVEAYGFVRKGGALMDWGGHEWAFGFSVLSGHGSNYSFQVTRAEFDQLLFEHARSVGADTHDRVEITGLTFVGERPVSASWHDLRSDERGEIAFDFLVDASGRAGIMSTRYLKNRRTHEVFQNVGIWGYWAGARRPDQLGRPFCPQGAIATCAIPDGWFWGIPLHDGSLSVGLVLHKESLKDRLGTSAEGSGGEIGRDEALRRVYLEAIAQSPIISQLVEGATLPPSPLKAETDYSYVSERFCGPGYLLSGDAACFLDPLLSTGVHLAMFSALLGAASIASSMRGEVGEEEALRFYHTAYRHAYLRLLTLVSAFYQQHEGAEYFRKAQQLTGREYDGQELSEAFVSIVSGMEDLQDATSVDADRIIGHLSALQVEQDRFLRRAQQGQSSIAAGEQEEAQARANAINSVRSDFSLTPESAVHGLYVHTAPSLRLARVPVPSQSAVGD